MKNLIILFLIFALIVEIPILVFANGGDQRLVEGKYLINLSRSPFTPRVGIPTSFLASFLDIKTNKIISDQITAKISIAKISEYSQERKFIFEKDNLKVKDGILEFKYTFPEAGLYEIFFDFLIASEPDKIYKAPDFMIEVHPNFESKKQESFILIAEAFGILLAFLAGFFAGRKVKLKKL